MPGEKDMKYKMRNPITKAPIWLLFDPVHLAKVSFPFLPFSSPSYLYFFAGTAE